MNTKTWIVFLGLILAVCLGISVVLLQPGDTAGYAEISSQGEVLKTVDLRIGQEFTVTTPDGGVNTVTVRDGRIAVTHANCPDSYCMAKGFCNRGTPIVCLPNRLVIRFLGEQVIDAVVG